VWRFDGTFLHSKFGQRLFALFVACALVPILVLLLISYRSVSSELEAQAEQRLQELGKSTVMGIWDRLNLLDVELQLVEYSLTASAAPGEDQTTSSAGEIAVDPGRITSVVLERPSGEVTVIAGPGFAPPSLTEAQYAHLAAENPLLSVRQDPYGEVEVLLAHLVRPVGSTSSTVLWGQIEPTYLWWGPPLDNTLPAQTHLHILASDLQEPLLSTVEAPPALLLDLSQVLPNRSMGELEWQNSEGTYRAHYRSANTRPVFEFPSLTVVLSEARNLSLQPFFAFKRNLIGIVLLSLWIVLLLTISQIRRHLVPLEVLRKGTQQIAEGRFDARVSVDTGDELAELASSFNSMAGDLERQFKTLTTSNELVQAILSSLNTDRIVDTVLTEFHGLLESDRVVVTLTERDSRSVGHLYRKDSRSEQKEGPLVQPLADADLASLDTHRQHLLLPRGSACPSYFLCDGESTTSQVLALPIYLQDELAAIVAASLGSDTNPEDLDVASLRQVADQVAVALSNARLVEDLDALSWGTLTALARTIDVRSPWTMGHSERVMDMAQRIGRKMGLSESSLHSLLRGSLLHDVGKIGVPSEILDKAGSLTPDEMETVRRHVRIGVQILQPVPALQDVLPVVAQHHEWFDGSGYPAGVAGTEICLEARILAAVDCYDALKSDRPYRAALSPDVVVSYLVEQSGTQFDPQVIEVLLAEVRSESATEGLEEGPSSIAI